MSAKKIRIRVLYPCYYRGVHYEPGVYEVDPEVANGLVAAMHAVKEDNKPRKAAKLKEEV